MPTLFVIAGPNGIGKTTSSYDLVPANISIINSDEISKEIRNVRQSTLNLQEYANHEDVRLMEEQERKGIHLLLKPIWLMLKPGNSC